MARWMNDVDGVKQLRDELKLKAHLLGAEARERWESLERDFKKLEGELEGVRDAADSAAEDVSTAARLLVDSLRNGYEKIRKAL